MKAGKLAALAVSLIMVTSSFAGTVINTAGAAAVNIITNSTFDSGTTDWGIYKESGGKGTLSTENGKLALNVTSTGSLNYSVQMFYDIVPLYKNGVYHIKYDISSSVDRPVEGMIQQNGGTYQSYTWKKLNLTSEPQTVDYNFTMTADSDIMSKLVFNCGDTGEELPAHTIYLDNVTLELIDDSKVDYSAFRAYEPSIVVNQVGYKPENEKIAVFRDVTDETQFSVINADTKQTVYTGELYGETQNYTADETDYFGDFSEITEPGKYYITCGNLDDSYSFEIADNIYDNLLDDTVKMLYLQRCGTAVEDSTFSHVACHNKDAVIYGTSEKIDVSGGWHDAGDYGRYVVPGAKTIADLLYAYEANPTLYSDSTGIPESGNSVPDILDEARYELEWMLKMQAPSGGVYHKVTCETFPGYIMPEKETGQLIVTPVSTTATADFCASMAMAYEFYYNVDKEFALECLTAAKSAWGFLESNPNLIFKNPEDITTGAYNDTSDSDERYWAAAQMYRATQEDVYLNALKKMTVRTGMDWSTMGDYGSIALLSMKDIDTSSTVYTKAKKAIINQADSFTAMTENSPYGVAIAYFNWGSNMTVANAGAILGIAYNATGDEKYLSAAQSNINYLLGKNPNGECFVTGYGTVSPQNPHHRPSMARGQAMKGMLVGGVNSRKEDSAAKAYLAGYPAAKCYVDHAESYSTNEITIYWNSPLTYLLSLTDVQQVETVKGDVNTDGNVNVSDNVALQKYLVKFMSLNENQGRNSDMNEDDKVNVFDLILLKRTVIKSSDKPAVTTAVTTPSVTTTTTAKTTENNSSEPDSSATILADFRKGTSAFFEASDGWTNGNPFDCGWYADNAVISNNALNLTIDKDKSGQYNYSAAEYRTKNFYSYGYYETSMQAIKNKGVVSSFFTYTGPSDNNPWDEIDVEILGKDTTKVQFNYYTNGVGNHEYMYDLGFDASEGFHTYGFDWQPDKITWYVDGKAVYSATENLPSTAGKIMMNVWPGTGVNDWLEAFDGTTPLTAKYQWVTFKSTT